MKKNLLIKTVFFIMFLTVTGTIYSQVTMSQWRIHNGKGFIKTPKLSENGDPIAYNKAVIPKTTDNGWNLVPIRNNYFSLNLKKISKVNQKRCREQVDFTYFETFITIPKNTKFNNIGIDFIEFNDGARAYIFNSAHPNGAYLGEVKIGQKRTYKDYSSLTVIGEKNRIVIVQFNSCSDCSSLKSEIRSNGLPICIDCNFTAKVVKNESSCDNNKKSSAEIFVSGGNKPFKYTWSNGKKTKKITNLDIGRYYVKVEDCKGCYQIIPFEIQANETTPPVVKTKNISIKLDASGKASIKPSQINAGSYDNCGIKSIHLDKDTFNCSNIGKNTVKLTVFDKNNNKASKTAIVTVEDTMAPKFLSIPSDITIGGSCNGSIVTWKEPKVTDNCFVANITSNYKSGDTFPVGKTKIIYTATDKYNNKTSVSFNVIIKKSALKLHITNIKNTSCKKKSDGTISVKAEGGCEPYKFIWSNGSTSNHIDNLTPGKYTVTVIDKNGNKYTRDIIISVMDKIAPVFSNVPADIVINGNPCSLSTATWTEPTATDNCSIPKITSNYKPGDSFAPGINKVVYTATDDSNNKTHISFNVTVLVPGLKLHVIKVNNVYCMEDATGSAEVEAEGGCKPYKFIWSNGKTTKIVKNLKGGKYTVTVIDKAGTKYTKTVTIDSKDYVAPKFSNIPSDIVVTGNCNGKVVKWKEPKVTDNCSVAKITSNYKSGDTFSYGTTKVIYTATDSSGNITKTSFNVTVNLSSSPLKLKTIVKNVDCTENPNGSIIVIPTGGCKPYKFIWNNGKTDNYLKNLKGGKYTVIVTDNSGNKITKTITIKSNDLTAPKIINIPSDIIINDPCTNSYVTWKEPIISDNCSFKVTSNYHSGDLFPLGTTTVTYTATDSSGNTAKASFNIQIKNNLKPLTLEMNKKDIGCNNYYGGSITVNPKGGCKPYKYIWNNGSTSNHIDNLRPGKYIVTVTDRNNDSIQKTILITKTPILISGIKKLPVYECPTTSFESANIIIGLPGQPTSLNLEGFAKGGSGNYKYKWDVLEKIDIDDLKSLSNINIKNPIFTPVIEKESCKIYKFKLTVTDKNNCSASTSVTIRVINVNKNDYKNPRPNKKIAMCYTDCMGYSETIYVNPNEIDLYTEYGALLGSCDSNCNDIDVPRRNYLSCAKSRKIKEQLEKYKNSILNIYYDNTNYNIKLSSLEENARINLINFNGEIIEQFKITKNNYNELSLKTKKLSSGIYILQYISNDKKITKKLIIK